MAELIPIYHFTHRANLPKILEAGLLLCDRLCRESDLTVRDIAYSGLKQKRAVTEVEVPPGGTLADYVPFYFGTRSPMMYAYKKGKVTGKPENLDNLVYFATDVEDVADTGRQFAFTDGHPIREPKAFYNDLADLSFVDFPLMKERMWIDTDDDPDRRRRRQAEFLVHQRIELNLFRVVGTRTARMKNEVMQLLEEHRIALPCDVKSNWYYD
ncbi:DUF4433 domain-containing protein [Actinoplanes sp. TBRC 11911]|uniref:type II toxin-antitoxin system toxin DNA ADP-ribosyl transferase DarT n=1 Tax=Actinoplanes sp. TBRC 11911 TaxID=2729386 RepID=UPI00145EA1EC|nr:DUF4433 domain-containing protein [Actinoplanes sp. TBRC 11911]NMO50677.1 DUF4433 domain-containing protein [Actinoplanes sp. TBRC 11911]